MIAVGNSRRQRPGSLLRRRRSDPGHGPFSHAFEQVGRRLGLKLADHKYVSDLLIRDSEVSGASKGGGGKGKVRPLPDDLTRIQS